MTASIIFDKIAKLTAYVQAHGKTKKGKEISDDKLKIIVNTLDNIATKYNFNFKEVYKDYSLDELLTLAENIMMENNEKIAAI